LEESDTDLLNLRDEMLGELNKLKYLLTLSWYAIRISC
jgi:hypothetical protein